MLKALFFSTICVVIVLILIAGFSGCAIQEELGSVNLDIPSDAQGVVEQTVPPESAAPAATETPAEVETTAPNATNSAPPSTTPGMTQPPESSGSAPLASTEIVEIIKEIPVELPPKIIEVVKEVYLDTPLDGMDMRERQLAFIRELDKKYEPVLKLKIGGGEYCYGFTSHTEYLIGYHFVGAGGEVVFSYQFPPLSLEADKATLAAIQSEIARIQDIEVKGDN